MASSYSFDIVCEVNLQEVDNALNQAQKELGQRYDLRGSNSTLELDLKEKAVRIKADGEHFVHIVYEIFQAKCIKRGISVLALDAQKPEDSGGRTIRQTVKLKSGLDKEAAKKITTLIKDSKLKVQAQIQDEQVRVTGKSKDDLQEVMTLLRGASLPFPIEFSNYR